MNITGTSVIPPGMVQCGICGMFHQPMHACGGTPTYPALALDIHHWLYKAGYEEGRRAADRERDLSPLGKRRLP